ncbi:MAG: 6-bladed beta-propeller [Candidatus Eisenbacteria bacterium]
MLAQGNVARGGCGVRAGIALAILATVGPAAPAADEATARVENKDQPAEGTLRLEVTERWRTGGDDSEILIGDARAAAVNERGEILVLDNRLVQVLVFSPQGELLRTLGREGEGPGEFRMPLDLVLLQDGRIGICQAMPGKIVLLDSDGNPAGSIDAGGNDPTAGGFSFFDEVRASGDHLVVAGRQLKRAGQSFERRRYLARLHPDGREIVRFIDETAPDRILAGRFVEREEHFVTRGGWALGPDGRVYAARDRDRYAIDVYDPDGTPVRVITREFAPWKRTAEERGRVGEGLLVMINGQRVEVEAEPEDHDPCVIGMQVMADGELWVLNSRGTREQPAGILQTYDVFDPQGVFARRVAIAMPGDPQQDRLFLLDGRRMLLVKNAADAARRQAAPEDEDAPARPLEIIYYEAPVEAGR